MRLLTYTLKIGEFNMNRGYQGFDTFGDMMSDKGYRSPTHKPSRREQIEHLLSSFGFKRKKYNINIVELENPQGVLVRVAQNQNAYEMYNSDGSLHSNGLASDLIKKLELKVKKLENESSVE